jgi:hypothetical protein
VRLPGPAGKGPYPTLVEYAGSSERPLDPSKSTLLAPVLSLRRADVAPLPKGRFTKVTVPLYYEGHAYRKGSRIRITIAAPGGDQPVWAFAQTTPSGRATVAIAHSPKLPSRVILPVVPGVAVPRPASVSGAPRRAVPELSAGGQPVRERRRGIDARRGGRANVLASRYDRRERRHGPGHEADKR